MATVERNVLDLPMQFRRFSEQEQKHQVEDDLTAGYGVGLLLMAIFTMGIVLMGTTVLLTLL